MAKQMRSPLITKSRETNTPCSRLFVCSSQPGVDRFLSQFWRPPMGQPCPPIADGNVPRHNRLNARLLPIPLPTQKRGGATALHRQ
jgi:hypothetical protein